LDNAHSILLPISLSLPFSLFSFSSSVPSPPRSPPPPSSSFSQQRAELSSYPRAALKRAFELSRDPIRYPIFRISPLLLLRPRIASRDRFVVVRHSRGYQSQLNSRVFRICASSSLQSTPTPSLRHPRSLFSHLIYRFHSSISSAYQPLSVDARPSSIYPFFHVSFATSSITSPSALRSSSSAPSSPHVHPRARYPVRAQIVSLGLVPVVVPSTEPASKSRGPSLSPPIDLFVSPLVVWALLRPLSARLCSVVVCMSRWFTSFPYVFSFWARLTHPIRFD